MKNTFATLLMVQKQNPLLLRHFPRAAEGYFGEHAPTLEETLRRFHADVDAVTRDDGLTQKGRAERIGKLATAARTAVNSWRAKHVDGCDAHAAALRGEMVTASAKGDVADRIERALLKSEIRAQLRGLTAIERETVYRTADPLTREAIEEGPPVIAPTAEGGFAVATPLVRPEVVAEVREATLAAANPEASQKIAELGEVRGLYAGAATVALREIESVGPEAKPAPSVRVVV